MTAEPGGEGTPRATMTALDAAVIVMGVVLGVGLFRSPSVVAANSASGTLFLVFWLVGGGITLAGALCYAELATAYPDTGGEYYLLSRAYGSRWGFFVAWARIAVIQTGSLGIQAYVIGDYAAGFAFAGNVSSSVIAAVMVVLLTAVNVAGLRPGRFAQYVFTGGTVVAIAAVVVAGFVADPVAAEAAVEASGSAASGDRSVGLALVFVLLAFGGWSEGAYVSAEVQDRKHGVGRALLWATGAITLLYFLTNAAYLRGLGLGNVAASSAVAADLVEAAWGSRGSAVIRGAIVLAALSSANAIIMTGARSTYALGRDWPQFGFLGRWDEERQTPRAALLVQGVIALMLVAFGAFQRSGFESMVAYTAPVFWLILFFTGASVIVFRRRDPDAERPYRVPLYPLTPLVFCAAAGYMVYSSVLNAGLGSLLGLGVLAAGIPFAWLDRPEMGEGPEGAGERSGPGRS